MEICEQDKKILLGLIEAYQTDTPPVAFHSVAQPVTAALWLVIQAAMYADVLDKIIAKIEAGNEPE